MKRFIYCSIISLLFCVTAGTLPAEEETDPGLRPPIEVAKEYIAKKYECDVDDLTTGEAMIGRSGAHIDINHGYNTDKVILRRKDFESPWEVEGSDSLHQY